MSSSYIKLAALAIVAFSLFPAGPAKAQLSVDSYANPAAMLENQWVCLDKSGQFSGRVLELASTTGGKVYMVNSQGQTLEGVPVSANGRFRSPRLESGLYTLIYVSNGSMAGYSVHVCSRPEAEADNPAQMASTLYVLPVAMAPKSVWNVVSSGLGKQSTILPQINEEKFVELMLKRRADSSIVTLPTPVRALPDGRVRLKFYRSGLGSSNFQPAVKTRVQVRQAGRIVLDRRVNERGELLVSNLRSGSFDIIARGALGFAVTRFDLQPVDLYSQADTSDSLSNGEYTLVVQDSGGGSGVEIQMASIIPTSGIPELPLDESDETPIAGTPTIPGTSPIGGGGGGSGGGFGGGGFGGLGSAAAAAAVAAAIDDDNDGIVAPAVVPSDANQSPVIP